MLLFWIDNPGLKHFFVSSNNFGSVLTKIILIVWVVELWGLLLFPKSSGYCQIACRLFSVRLLFLKGVAIGGFAFHEHRHFHCLRNGVHKQNIASLKI